MAVSVDGNICSNGLDTVLFTDKLENHQLWWEHLGSGDRPTLKKLGFIITTLLLTCCVCQASHFRGTFCR